MKMKILRVEDVVYGVEDVAAGIKFYEDWGLECVARGAHGGDFALPSGQTVRIRAAGDRSLPSTSEVGSTMREVVWGIDSTSGLEEIAAELSRDREVSRDKDGVLHARDPHGFAVGFRVAAPQTVPEAPAPSRLNRPFDMARQARPRRLGHVVYNVTRAMEREGSDFYTERLGFRISDRSYDFGDFLRAPGGRDHHNLGLFWMRDKAAYGHVAFEVGSIDEVMLGGSYMASQGWKPANKPGRHIVGSNVFWNFLNPSGGQSEYLCDMDLMDDDWQPRFWEKFPGFAHWHLG